MKAIGRLARRRFSDLRQFGVTALVTYAGIGLSLISAPMLAQVIGADGRGVLAGSFVAVNVLAWLSPLGLQRGIALQVVKRDEVSVWGVVAMTMLGIAAAIGTFFMAPILGNDDPRMILGIRIASSVLLLAGIGNMGHQLAMMRGAVWSHNLIRAGTQVLPSLLQIVLFLVGALDLVNAYIVMFAGQVFASLYGVVLAVFAISGRSRAPVPWAFSLRFWSASAFDSVAGRLDQVLLAALTAAPVVGVYAIAVTCANASGGLTQALNQVAFSKFVGAEKTGAVDPRTLRRMTIVGVATSAATGLVVILAVWWLWRPLFGASFAGLTPIVAVLVLAKVLQSQWMLRVLHDSAKESAGALLPASLISFLVLIASVTVLYTTGNLTGVTMAIAYLGMMIVRLSVRELVRLRRRQSELPVDVRGS